MYTIQQGVMELEIIFVKGLVLSSVPGAQQAFNRATAAISAERVGEVDGRVGGCRGRTEWQGDWVGGDRAQSRRPCAAFQSVVTRGQVA